MTPGERGDRIYEGNMITGEVELDDRVWQELRDVADSTDNAD